MINMENELTNLETKQNEVVASANLLTVTNKESYDYAMDFLKQIKTVAKNVESYWAEPKKKANEVWKDIVAKEKAMMSPLSDAESITKKKMTVYADEQRRIEQEIQRQQELARQIESDRLMKEAADAENKGDTLQAEINMSMAESLVNSDNFVGNTKQSGTREVKELRIVNESLVPSYINGVCIRPVDLVAVKKLYSLTGSLPDGIIVETKTVIAVR